MDNDRVAVFIDADNTAAKYMDVIVNEVKSNYGVITIQRAYGDWSSDCLKPWNDIMLKYSITPMQQFANTTGKNSTDIAMVVDIMDILYTKDIETFCLVTSDSDFTKIASRLRESGKRVIGMGKRQTVSAFISACNEFKYIDILFDSENEESSDEDNAGISRDSDKKATNVTPIEVIKSTLSDLIVADNGRINIGKAKQFLIQTYSDFDERNYGFSKFSTFINSLDNFEINNKTNDIITNETTAIDADTVIAYITEYIRAKKKKHYTSSEIQNIIIKKYSNITLKSLGYSTMKSLLKTITELKIDSDGKYYIDK